MSATALQLETITIPKRSADAELAGLVRLSPWRPWPSEHAPEQAIVANLPEDTDVVVLAGARAAGPTGRYGMVATPRAIARLTPGPGVIADAVDRPRPRALLLGYELGAPEVYLDPTAPPPGQPAGLAVDLACVMLIDHETRQMCLLADDDDARSRADAAALLDAARGPPASEATATSATLRPTVSDDEHCRRIRAAQEHIAAGDIYQANITRRLAVDGAVHPGHCFAALGRDNPVAHGAYLRVDGIELLSNSMETLLTYDPRDRFAHSYPIKGTRRRGWGPGVDDEARAERDRLALDPKERAEHVMIVDLVRNDLGRVCVPGTVRVPELMGLHPFRGLWHGVSDVRGQLAPDRSPGELVAALFPGGSITGAPKRRAMQIIGELESEPRGFYTGSLGLVLPSGWMTFSILIRTLVRDARGWSVSVGGGIVADSDPEREVEETWTKVEVFRRVLGSEAA